MLPWHKFASRCNRLSTQHTHTHHLPTVFRTRPTIDGLPATWCLSTTEARATPKSTFSIPSCSRTTSRTRALSSSQGLRKKPARSSYRFASVVVVEMIFCVFFAFLVHPRELISARSTFAASDANQPCVGAVQGKAWYGVSFACSQICPSRYHHTVYFSLLDRNLRKFRNLSLKLQTADQIVIFCNLRRSREQPDRVQPLLVTFDSGVAPKSLLEEVYRVSTDTCFSQSALFIYKLLFCAVAFAKVWLKLSAQMVFCGCWLQILIFLPKTLDIALRFWLGPNWN